MFVARHDADDISPPDRFAIQLAAVESAADISLVTGGVETFGQSDDSFVARHSPWQPRLEWDLLFSNVVGAGAHVMFPRFVGGTRVLFPARQTYAEDYGLWCNLSRRGRVLSPSAVIYRYRRHESSISATKRSKQHECFRALRHEYQSLYLGTLSANTSAAISQFWVGGGDRPLPTDLRRTEPVLAELMANFLCYIGRRYGTAVRQALELQIDSRFAERLGYWLYRSLRYLDAKAFREVIALAGAKAARRDAIISALEQAARALSVRMRRSTEGRIPTALSP
jgi:hypothetical protein